MGEKKRLRLESANAYDGVESIDFMLTTLGRHKNVIIGAYMQPDEEVIDASSDDFPQFDCTVTIEEYRKLRQMFIDFNP